MNGPGTTSANSLLEFFFAEPGVGRCLVAPDGHVRRASPTWLRSVGLDLEAVLGADIVGLLGDGDVSIPLLARARAGHHVDVPRHVRRIHGRETWWEGSVDPIAMDDGTGLVISTREVATYELLARHSRDIVLFMRSDDGRILEANAAAVTTYGYSRAELLALSITDLRAPDARAQAREQLAAADAGGLLFETVHRRKDGSTFPVEVSSRGESVSGARTLISIVRDISDRKRADEEARAIAARDAYQLRLADTLRPLSDPGEIQAQAARLLGEQLRATRVHYGEISEDGQYGVVEREYRVDGVSSTVGRYHLDAFGPVVMNEFRAGRTLVIASVNDDARLSAGERAATTALGIGAYVIHPLVKDGRPLAILVVHQAEPRGWTAADLRLIDDTAARTWSSVARARVEQALREEDRRKSEFLAVLSHELRNPLAPIRNSIYLLERAPPGSERARHAREVIARQTEHLTHLVDDLLDMTRISRGKIQIGRMRLDLREVIRRSCHDHQSLFDTRHVQLRIEATTAAWIEGDATRMAQVVGNLLQNAAKFTHEGGTATVRVEAVGAQAQIRVRDDGIGISPDLLPRLFEPFVQADGGLARTKGGLGLGLALVKGLVNLHGGTVEARSDGPGRGAEFLVTLPLVVAP
ncbi:MAG: ATP-binding protein, partial [Anaeromyxobacteraceae bacterium]